MKSHAHKKATQALDKAMDRFESAHTDTIREAVSDNAEIRETAKLLGWGPDRPLGEEGLQEARP